MFYFILVEPQVIHARAVLPTGELESREIYFFREGTIVLWNIPETEKENILQ